MHLSDLEPLRPLAVGLGCIGVIACGIWAACFNSIKPPFQSGKPHKPGVYAVKVMPTDVYAQFSYFNGYDFHQAADTITDALRATAVSRINWYWQEIEKV